MNRNYDFDVSRDVNIAPSVLYASYNGCKKRLLELIDSRCLTTDVPVALSSGAASSFYFDGKRAALHGECLDLICDAFFAEMRALPVWPDAIGGLTMGADFIVAAMLLAAYRIGLPLEGSIARKEPKKHGTKTPVENELPAGTRIVVIDDTLTTGSSILQAAEKFQAVGYEVVGVIALIDREAGGHEVLTAKLGCPVRSVFRKSDFVRLSDQ